MITRKMKRALRQCGRCGEFKTPVHFSRCKRMIGGLSYRCKACDSAFHKAGGERYRARNRKYAKSLSPELARERSKRHKETGRRYRETSLAYEESKDRRYAGTRAWAKTDRGKEVKRHHHRLEAEARKHDLVARHKHSLRCRLRAAFKLYSVGGKVRSSSKYGINWKAILDHIGPCPGSSKEWHIDHIVPLCHFDFDDPDQVRIAFTPDNHQWLPASMNCAKRGDADYAYNE